jgi:shikimate dehydrogenase
MLPLTDDLLTDKSCCYDMVYGAEPTVFMRWAAQHTAWSVADGLGMLVEQAAESFYLWRGLRPQTGTVIAELRATMEAG